MIRPAGNCFSLHGSRLISKDGACRRIGNMDLDGCRTCPACSGRRTIPFSEASSTRRRGCAAGSSNTGRRISTRCICWDCSTTSAIAWSRRCTSSRQALKVNSGSSDAMSNLGLALDASGRYEEAISSFRHALQLAPDHPEILFNLGNVHLKLGRIAEAMASYEGVLANEPTHVGTLVNRGNALLRLNRPGEAIASYDHALTLLPGHPQILTNRGHALPPARPARRGACGFQRGARGCAANSPKPISKPAMTHLSLGDFEAGWKEYEWRWKTDAFAGHRRQFRRRGGSATEPISGKTILLHAEQGFGDTIQFIRYAPLLAGQRRQCRLRGAAGAAAAAVAARRTSRSLPAASRFRHSTCIVPCSAFRLHSGRNPGRSRPRFHISLRRRSAATYWRERLPAGGPRAGFVWSGSPSHKNDSNRSIPLARLAALFDDAAVAMHQPSDASCGTPIARCCRVCRT